MEKLKERECPNFDPKEGHNSICMPNLNPQLARYPNVYYIRQFCKGRFEECGIYKDIFQTER